MYPISDSVIDRFYLPFVGRRSSFSFKTARDDRGQRKVPLPSLGPRYPSVHLSQLKLLPKCAGLEGQG